MVFNCIVWAIVKNHPNRIVSHLYPLADSLGVIRGGQFKEATSL